MKRILVCEDEDVIRDFVVINLKRAGYDVTDVNCGEEALRVFESEHGNFDVALLDIMMPGIDGNLNRIFCFLHNNPCRNYKNTYHNCEYSTDCKKNLPSAIHLSGCISAGFQQSPLSIGARQDFIFV